MLPDKLEKRWGAFYGSVRRNDVLDPRTTLLVHLAAAMAVACYS